MEAWSDCTGLDAPAFASGAHSVHNLAWLVAIVPALVGLQLQWAGPLPCAHQPRQVQPSHSAPNAPNPRAVTPSILSKPLSRLLMDIVRAQAQAAPPGMDAEVVAEVQQARAAGAAAAAAAAGPSAGEQPGQAADGSGAAAAAEEGGEEALKSKLQDYVMLDGKERQTAPMSLDQLKQQVGGRPGKLKALRAAG